MSSYIRLSDNHYPLHQGDIRLEVEGIGEEFVCPDGYEHVEDALLPIYTHNQYIVEDAPIRQNNVWVKQFRVVDLTNEQIAQRDAWLAEQQAKFLPR